MVNTTKLCHVGVEKDEMIGRQRSEISQKYNESKMESYKSTFSDFAPLTLRYFFSAIGNPLHGTKTYWYSLWVLLCFPWSVWQLYLVRREWHEPNFQCTPIAMGKTHSQWAKNNVPEI